LPSWLVKVARDATWHRLRLELADGGACTGVMLRAQRQGDEVVIDWQGQAQPTVVTLNQAASLTMMTLLEAAPPGAPPNAWDRQMAHERFTFHIEFAARMPAPLCPAIRQLYSPATWCFPPCTPTTPARA